MTRSAMLPAPVDKGSFFRPSKARDPLPGSDVSFLEYVLHIDSGPQKRSDTHSDVSLELGAALVYEKREGVAISVSSFSDQDFGFVMFFHFDLHFTI